jgi:hypothetical protein
MAYLLDANVFIQAKRLHYGMNVKCMTPFAMLRSEKARFILEGNAETSKK